MNAPLFDVQDKDSMIQVLRVVDKANGYCFGDLEERNMQAMMSAAVGADFQFDSYPSRITMVTHCDSFGLESKPEDQQNMAEKQSTAIKNGNIVLTVLWIW